MSDWETGEPVNAAGANCTAEIQSSIFIYILKTHFLQYIRQQFLKAWIFMCTTWSLRQKIIANNLTNPLKIAGCDKNMSSSRFCIKYCCYLWFLAINSYSILFKSSSNYFFKNYLNCLLTFGRWLTVIIQTFNPFTLSATW